MQFSSCRQRRARHGFTLVELLVVIVIIMLVAALTVPALTSVMRSMRLDQAGRLINDQIALARQTALAKNHSVEVRFYQFGDPDAGEHVSTPNSGRYRAIQLFEIPESGAPVPVAIGKVMRLPATIVIDSGTASPDTSLSTIVSQASSTSWPALTASNQQTVTLPGIGTAYNSVSFRFLPNGSVNLPSDNSWPWFLTLHKWTDGNALSTAPADFFTIQINPDNGHLNTFRP